MSTCPYVYKASCPYTPIPPCPYVPMPHAACPMPQIGFVRPGLAPGYHAHYPTGKNKLYIPYVKVSFGTQVPKLNFHIKFLEVNATLNQSQDATWHFLGQNLLNLCRI
jgi:hypothetical protein